MKAGGPSASWTSSPTGRSRTSTRCSSTRKRSCSSSDERIFRPRCGPDPPACGPVAGGAAVPLVVGRPTGPGPSPRSSRAAGGPAGGGRTSAGRTDGSAGRAGGGAGRAGRDLVAAFTVGGGLAALVLASLLLWRPAFLVIVVAGDWLATWELVRALRAGGARPPRVPLFAGGPVM